MPLVDAMPTMVRMTTSAGDIDIALYTEDCPDNRQLPQIGG